MYKIAIDGPSGAGKSTIAKLLADKLNIEYIDTGAMYRAIAYKIIVNHVDIEDEMRLSEMLLETKVDFSAGKIFLDDIEIGDFIRTPEVTKMASESSAIPAVRKRLVDLQRKMGEDKSIIMDGRDIGTNVLKDAEFKFFLTASPEIRAERRYKEMQEKNMPVSYETVYDDIMKRDYNDEHREIDPLVPAEDTHIIDTSDMSIDEVIGKLCGIICDTKL